MIAVLTAGQSAAWDRATIATGVPSRVLMQRAGAAAAGEIARRYPDDLRRGIAVFAGAGNNGGDAWVVARALRATGIAVHVDEIEAPRTEDARAERTLALSAGPLDPPSGGERLVVDGVLGIGGRGDPRGAAAGAIARMARAREGGARIIALDVPSGLDADLGTGASVVADLTLAFGGLKRGLLVARDRCGELAVLEIGLASDLRPVDALELADEAWALSCVPSFAAGAHKGDRRRVVLIGGAPGMAGAVILAGRAALRAGAGLVRILAAPESMPAIQSGLPEALCDAWGGGLPADWAHAIALGPGLGATPASRALVERVVQSADVPLLLDADALNVFAGDLTALATLLGGKRAVLTPHPAELSRLAGCTVAETLDRRWEIGLEIARQTGAVVLLKGVPTIVSAPDGRVVVCARGTPALATGGSGDVLSGMGATLLAQMRDPFEAIACAAWAHGRAAEIAQAGRAPRGTVLGDVIEALPLVWRHAPRGSVYPVLAELPAISA